MRGLHGFQSVDLTELDRTAPMRSRKDRKYLIPVDGLGEIIERVDESAVRVLEVGARRQFDYESIYFDTPDLKCFRATAHRRRRRFKVRTRRYVDRGDTFLEAKVRLRKRLTVKHRLEMAGRDHGRLTPAGLGFLGRIDGVGPAAADLSPVLTTSYRRVNLLVNSEMARVTIDTALGWRHREGASIWLPDIAIVETKTSGPPTWFDHLLWASGHRPVRVSKYGTGLAALDPDLPANAWHRVLHEHFGCRSVPTPAVGLESPPRRAPAAVSVKR